MKYTQNIYRLNNIYKKYTNNVDGALNVVTLILNLKHPHILKSFEIFVYLLILQMK